jgi:formate dehydrogenase subunit gamma
MTVVSSARVPRFDRVERVTHWCTATLMLILLATGFSLYAGPLSTLVGRRELVRTVHVYSGLVLPVPALIAIMLRAGGQLRADLGHLNRWSRDDRAWWSRRRRPTVELGKFNPGQKLNAAFIGAGMIVMLMSGSIMRWYGPFSDSWRQGATFVHDWFAIGLLLAIIGHIALALRDADALAGMARGYVSAGWARSNRPRWYAEVVESDDASGSGGALGDAHTGVPEHAREVGLRAGEVAVVDRVHGGAGDGVGEREL